jgi:hypothetical protein
LGVNFPHQGWRRATINARQNNFTFKYFIKNYWLYLMSRIYSIIISLNIFPIYYSTILGGIAHNRSGCLRRFYGFDKGIAP